MATESSRLSIRLQAIADLIPPRLAVADVGTDHGLLPIALMRRGTVKRVIAIDRRPTPLALATANIAAAGLSERIDLRLGDGIRALKPGEAAVAILAGLGCRTICRLIAAADTDGLGLCWLVLQPERDPWLLRAFLAGQGWRIEDEALVTDGGRLYTAIRAIRDQDGGWWEQWDVADRLLGRPNVARGDAALAAQIAHHRTWIAAEVVALQGHGGNEALLTERLAWLAALESMAAAG